MSETAEVDKLLFKSFG